MPRLIISTTGTSLFSNSLKDKESRDAFFLHSNDTEKEYPNELAENLLATQKQLIQELKGLDIKPLRRRSAELNGIFGFYNNHLKGAERDIHILICTDTFQGKLAGEVIKSYLDIHFSHVEMVTPMGLSTKNEKVFMGGISDLLKWCDETLNSYKNSSYEVIFNLTGSFKSLQGYMNTIGMFYADKIIYIFETGESLIEIPKLPILIDEQVFRTHTPIFLMMSQDHFFSKNDLKGIPETMLFEVGEGIFGLSPWGELAWNNVKQKILSEKLIELPFLVYGDSFKKDFDGTKGETEKVKLQETLGFVSGRLRDSKGDVAILKGGQSGGVLYDNYTGKNDKLGHFRINQSDRVSCEARQAILHLRHFGAHSYVNNNP